LGKAVALDLAKRGATVHMLCRDPVRGNSAKEDIISISKNNNVILQVVDVSRPSHIKEFADRLLSNPDFKLNILVNNAGVSLLS
jgi:dehydrogenase/reductase SDR family protein 12